MSGGRRSFFVELDLGLGALGESQLVSFPSGPSGTTFPPAAIIWYGQHLPAR